MSVAIAPIRTLGLLALTLLLAACGSRQQGGGDDPARIHARIVGLIPASVADRQGWATDIQAAFAHQHLVPSRENVCAVLAVTEQESNYQVDPAVPGLGRIAGQEIERRAARLHIPAFMVRTALSVKSPNGKSWDQRLSAVRSEKALSALYDDLIASLPLGRQLFAGLNPVHTGGPMQVSVEFAERNARDYPWPISGSVRQEVFTRRGGMYFGIQHLLGYEVDYPSPLYRFADFNAGFYASRNAAFQQAVSLATGTTLALDGDLVAYGSLLPGQTEQAVRTLGKSLDMSPMSIHRALEDGETAGFSDSELYRKVYALAERRAGKALPRAILPGIKLQSPKITRDLSTAWFAQRVDSRYRKCLAR